MAAFKTTGASTKLVNINYFHLLYDQVLNQPEHVAIYHDESTITYHELALRVHHCAQHFSKQGISPETLVGIYLERSLNFIVTALAIMKLGAFYLPLDVSAKNKRVLDILGESDCQWLIVDCGEG